MFFSEKSISTGDGKTEKYTLCIKHWHILLGDFYIIAFVPPVHKFKWENHFGILNISPKT